MSDPIPKTMPRSTLACPPAKNFIDQYSKNNLQTAPQISSKPSTPNIDKVGKNSEKELAVKPPSK